jgi:hypothetical protein
VTRLVVGLAVAIVLVIATATGCGRSDTRPASSPTATTPAPTKDGHLGFTLLTLRCGLTAVAGSHSEGVPDGQFCSARLRVTNADPEFHTYVARDQRLEGVSGRRGRADTFAMAVRRQSDDVQIGGHDLIEVELWFDVPLGATVTGLRVEGDRDVTGFMNRSIVPHAPDGVLLPMTPAT